MKLLALDIGTKMGWAWLVTTSPSHTYAGTWSLLPPAYWLCEDNHRLDSYQRMCPTCSKKTSKQTSPWAMRFHLLWTHLEELAPERVFFENVAFKGSSTAASQLSGGYHAIISLWCYRNDVQLAPVAVGTIKHFWAGKGNADKEQMRKAAIAKGEQVDGLDDNAIDALALLRFAQEVM